MPGVNRPAGEPRAGAGEGEGVLVLAATPIGRPEDAPPRLSTELARADVVAAEDTRRLKRLTTDLDVQIVRLQPPCYLLHPVRPRRL